MTGEKTLAEMRMRGARPAGFIVITECRHIARNARNRELYPLSFDPEKVEDFRVIHGLDVRLVTRLSRDKVAPQCLAILEAKPRSFGATYHGRHEIEHDRIIPYAAR